MRYVLYVNDSDMMLGDFERDADGNVVRGEVANGGWNFVIQDGEMQIKSGSRVVGRNKVESMELIEVDTPKTDYNYVLRKAAEIRKARKEVPVAECAEGEPEYQCSACGASVGPNHGQCGMPCI